ncbi:MAG: iron transporter FeoB [Syntrophomonadaceae bacterium]|jgi:Fe2+ transport system protein B|nr:iron transporter FeoB [Syntrophomonadaceae bacterium]
MDADKTPHSYNAQRNSERASGSYVVALAGNPNTGKSTVFNALTGLNQHTGNWPGKTVVLSQGKYICDGLVFELIDLPGTYSLLAHSMDEQVARDFICFGNPDAAIVVLDATCLERNLNLALQVLEITNKVVVCLNLMDEARRKKLHIDVDGLSARLGVPVVPTAARDGEGLELLVNKVAEVATGRLITNPHVVSYDDEIEQAIAAIEEQLQNMTGNNFNNRWLALRLLDRDQTVIEKLEQWLAAKQTGNRVAASRRR